MKKSILLTALFLLVSGPSMAESQPKNDKHSEYTVPTVHADTMATAFKQLGYKISRHDDSNGDPHFVVKDPGSNVNAMAIFFDDCVDDRCEDVTLYAEYAEGKKLNAEALNHWNHIGSKLRSKAFMSNSQSGDGEVPGISLTISYMSDSDLKQIKMLVSLFMVETQMFAASLK